MALQIALAFSQETEAELKNMGFEKKEVYVKLARGGTDTKSEIEAGDREFFHMDNIPYQFVTTSWWGAGPD